FMSLLTRRTLIVGFLYAAFFEGLLANMPFSIRWLTVIYYARLLAYRSMEFGFTQPGGRKVDIAAELWQLGVRTAPTLGDHLTLGPCLTVLLVGSLVLTSLAAYLCSSREFHVKTPEGG